MNNKATGLFRSIKTAHNKSCGRRGSLLILVLIIMAVSMILITSALMITVAARNRYYNSALSSQANLTAKSVAKTIGDAVTSGDLTVSEIQALAAANGGSGSTVVVTSSATATIGSVSAGNNSIAPGLKGAAGTSYTTAGFSNYPSTATPTYIKVTVTTYLDAGDNTSTAQDSVSVLLQKQVTTGSAAYPNLMTVGRDDSDNTLGRVSIGQGTTSSATIAPIVFNGSVTLSASDLKIYSDIVIMGQAKFSADADYYGNVIFYGKNASLFYNGGGGMKIHDDDGDADTTDAGNMIILGDSANVNDFFTSSYGVGFATGLDGSGGYTMDHGIYVANKILRSSTKGTFKFFQPADGAVVDTKGTVSFTALNGTDVTGLLNMYHLADGSGTVTAGSTTKTGSAMVDSSTTYPIITTLKAAVAAKYSGLSATAARVLPTKVEAYQSAGLGAYIDTTTGVSKTGAEIVAALAPTPTLLTVADLNTAGTRTYNGASYYINTNAANQIGNYAYVNPSDYSILQFDLTAHSITIYVTGSQHLAIACGRIQFINGGANRVGKIILLDQVGIDIATNNSGDAIDNGIIGATHTGYNASVNDYVVDSIPYVQIAGLDGNAMTVGAQGSLEGYVGLYGTGGSLITTGSYLYARVEASVFNATSGSMTMVPYCPPAPSGISGGGGASTTFYSVAGYVVT